MPNAVQIQKTEVCYFSTVPYARFPLFHDCSTLSHGREQKVSIAIGGPEDLDLSEPKMKCQ